MTIQAKYRSWCRSCDQSIEVGEWLTSRGPEWVHQECPDQISVPDVVPPACPDCFMVLPCTCGYYEGGGGR